MSNSIIEHMLTGSSQTIVLICLNHSERKRIRDLIWKTAKHTYPSLVKVWLPTAYKLRCISESEIILVTIDTAHISLRGRSIDVLLLTNTTSLKNRAEIYHNLSQQLKINSIEGIFYENLEEI